LVNYQNSAQSVSSIQRHNGLGARPLDDGGINDQTAFTHYYFKLTSQLFCYLLFLPWNI